MDSQDHVRSQPWQYIGIFLVQQWWIGSLRQKLCSLPVPTTPELGYTSAVVWAISPAPWGLRDTRTAHWGLACLKCLGLHTSQVPWGSRLPSKCMPGESVGVPLSGQRDPELLDVLQTPTEMILHLASCLKFLGSWGWRGGWFPISALGSSPVTPFLGGPGGFWPPWPPALTCKLCCHTGHMNENKMHFKNNLKFIEFW